MTSRNGITLKTKNLFYSLKFCHYSHQVQIVNENITLSFPASHQLHQTSAQKFMIWTPNCSEINAVFRSITDILDILITCPWSHCWQNHKTTHKLGCSSPHERSRAFFFSFLNIKVFYYLWPSVHTEAKLWNTINWTTRWLYKKAFFISLKKKKKKL